MRTLELKILPDAVAIIVAVCMWIVSLTVVPFRLPVTMRVAGVILIVVGLGVVQLAGVSFRRARTTVDPTKPGAASVLVVSGLYHFSRNPMYLGMALVLFGWAFFLLNALPIAFVAVFVFYIDRFQIVPEERALSALFGTEYDSYRAGVRRWL